MARNLNPKHSKCRRYGVKLCDTEKCPIVKRNYPGGMHGVKGRAKLTGYGERLAEKQKAKIVYGILEKQFSKYYKLAVKKGDAGENFLRLLEMRLDNVVYRLGFATTRRQARQMVNHAFFSVNGRGVDVPSYQVKIGDEIALKEQKKKTKLFTNFEEKVAKAKAVSWLAFDAKKLSGKVLDLPKKDEAENIFNVTSIIEFYSK